MAQINKDDLKIGVTFTPCKECDRVEVVRGRWQKEICGNGWNEWVNIICSRCNAKFENIDFPLKYHFCPNCGALMDREV